MRKAQLSPAELFKKAGWTAEWEAMGEARGIELGKEMGKEWEAISIAKNMIGLEIPFETVVLATKLDPEKVRALYNEG